MTTATQSAPAKWTKAVFNRSMWNGENIAGNILTIGHVCGCWGIHKNDPRDNCAMPWTITHIPTGKMVRVIATLKQGKQSCHVMNTAPGWEHITCDEGMTPEQTAAYRAAQYD